MPNKGFVIYVYCILHWLIVPRGAYDFYRLKDND